MPDQNTTPDLYQQARIALRDRLGTDPLVDDCHAVARIMEDHGLTPAAAVSAWQLATAEIASPETAAQFAAIPNDLHPAARHVDVSGLLDADFAVVVFVKDNDVAGLARLRAHAALDQLLDQHGISR